jgi:hypothetical protein
MSVGQQGPAIRGINYDTGTAYAPGVDSRPDWSPEVVHHHMSTIRGELHANAVNVFGSDPDRLLAAANMALDCGLQVWVQPRLPDADRDRTVAVVADVAARLEPLRAAGNPVHLNVGCELTVFAKGLIPGRNFERRARRLRWMWPMLPVINIALNRLLIRLAGTAREHFHGRITYGAGTWEAPLWRHFDTVGLNLYRDSTNHHRYPATLRLAHRHRKPILITEFGCCSYPGADLRGAEGDGIIDWTHPDGPSVVGEHRRDETVQATYVAELLELYAAAGIDGAFVFEYSEPLYPRSSDPQRDLDIASFGIVAVEATNDDCVTYTETPKEAFHELARRYRATDNTD